MIYDKVNRQRLDTLHPTVRAMAYQLYGKWQTAKREALITSGWRSPAEQQALWESGRVRPGPVVTNARGVPVPESYHCFGVAFDFCPADQHGYLLWNDAKKFTEYAKVGKLVGFEWGGDWPGRLRDLGHLQFTGGIGLVRFQEGETLPLPPT